MSEKYQNEHGLHIVVPCVTKGIAAQEAVRTSTATLFLTPPVLWIRIHKGPINRNKVRNSCFEVLDVLFCGLEASPLARVSFKEAWG